MRRRWTLPWSLLLALSFVSTVSAETVRHRCSNGLQVTVREEPSAPLVDWRLAFAAGSGHDEPGKEGTAHLLEHLLMESSVDRPAGELTRGVFLHTVHANAHTGLERLSFEATCLPSQVDSVLALEVARASGWAVDEEELERERSVVLEELAFRRRGSALGDLQDALIEGELAGHRYGRPIGGTVESVRAIEAEDLVQYSRRWLQLEGASLAVVGPVDAQALVARIDETLGQLPSQLEPHEVEPFPAPRGVGAVLDRSDMTGMLGLRMIRVPFENAEDLARSALLEAFLESQGLGSGWRQLRREAFHFSAFTAAYFYAPELGFDEIDSEYDAQRYLSYTWRDLELGVRRLRRAARFEELRERCIVKLEEEHARHTGSATDLAESGFDEDSTLRWDLALESARQMDATEAARWLEETLDSDRVSVGFAHGSNSGRKREVRVAGAGREGPVGTFRDPLLDLDAGRIERALERHRQADPMALQSLDGPGFQWLHVLLPDSRELRIGGWIEVPRLDKERPRDKPGVAQLFGHLMRFGFRRTGRDRDVPFQERRLPHDLELSAGPTQLRFEGAEIPERVGELVETLTRRLESSSFDLQVWQRLLEWSRALPVRDPVQFFLAESLLGEDHPFLSEWRVSRRTNEKLEYEDMEELHATFTQDGALRLFTVGPQPASELKPLLEPLLTRFENREWPQPDRIEFVSPQVPPGKVFPRFDSDEVSLQVVLGVTIGGPVGPGEWALLEAWVQRELWSKLRTETGLSYVVHVDSWPVGAHRVLQVRTGSAPEHARTAFRSLLEAARELADRGPTDAEFQVARLAALGRTRSALAEPRTALGVLQSASRSDGATVPFERAILRADRAEFAQFAKQTLGSGPRAYTVVGPLLEDELDAYRSIVRAIHVEGR